MTRISYSNITLGDPESPGFDMYVDITVEGVPEDDANTVATHTRDQAVRAMQALDQGATPEDVDGTGVSIDWERIAAGGGGA